jgi:hypothetical protein
MTIEARVTIVNPLHPQRPKSIGVSELQPWHVLWENRDDPSVAEAVAAPAPPPPAADIPDDWRDLPFPARRNLAAELTGNPVRSSRDIDAAIEEGLSKALRRNPED